MKITRLIPSQIKASQLPATVVLFLLASPFIVVYYASYVFNPVHASNLLLYGLLLIADAISIGTMLSLWITILLDVLMEEHHRQIHPGDDRAFLQSSPSLDVLITVAGEPYDVVKKTVMAAIAMDYLHQTFILDDGKSEEIQQLAEELGVHYITRNSREYAKSGNLNHGLKSSKADFFVIFDADQVPEKDFITKLLPYMADERIALVQSPQSFVNTHEFIAEGTAQAQEVFYRYICPAKNISISAFCVGTNMIFRRRAIDEIGGIYRVGHSEDIWTSRALHEQGWKSIFVNQIVARGQAPNTIGSFFRQQHRWAKGGLTMLFFKNSLKSSKLTIDQRIQYFFANSFYLVGFSMLVYIMLPIMYLLFGISPLTVGMSTAWLLHWLPFFALYYSLTWLLLGKIKLSTISTSLASFYPYSLAFFSTVFGTKLNWTPTTTMQEESEVIMNWIWPHVFLVIITVFAIIVGWFQPIDTISTFASTVWAGWNMYLLLVFIASDRKAVRESI